MKKYWQKLSVGISSLAVLSSVAVAQTETTKTATAASDYELIKNASSYVSVSQRHSSYYKKGQYDKSLPYNLYTLGLSSSYKGVNFAAYGYGYRAVGKDNLEYDNAIFRPYLISYYNLASGDLGNVAVNVELYPQVSGGNAYSRYYVDGTIKKALGTSYGSFTVSLYSALYVSGQSANSYSYNGASYTANSNVYGFDAMPSISFKPKFNNDLSFQVYGRVLREARNQYSIENAPEFALTDGVDGPSADELAEFEVKNGEKVMQDTYDYDWVASYTGFYVGYKINDKLSLSNETRYYRGDAFRAQTNDSVRYNNRLTLTYTMF